MRKFNNLEDFAKEISIREHEVLVIKTEEEQAIGAVKSLDKLNDAIKAHFCLEAEVKLKLIEFVYNKHTYSHSVEVEFTHDGEECNNLFYLETVIVF